MRHGRGFSLLELVLVVAMALLLLALSLELFGRSQNRASLRQAALGFAAHARAARQKAMATGAPVYLVITSDTTYEIRSGVGAEPGLDQYVNIEGLNAVAVMFCGWWTSAPDATTTDRPASSAVLPTFPIPTLLNGKIVYVYTPAGTCESNAEPNFGGGYHVVFCEEHGSTGASLAAPSGTAQPLAWMPNPPAAGTGPADRQLTRVWGKTSTVRLGAAGDVQVDVGIPEAGASVQQDPAGAAVDAPQPPCAPIATPPPSTPTITAITTSVNGTMPLGETCYLHCQAADVGDPQGQSLVYLWSVKDPNGNPAGSLLSNVGTADNINSAGLGPYVEWISPNGVGDTGTYSVACTVLNPANNQASASVPVTLVGQAPAYTQVFAEDGNDIEVGDPSAASVQTLISGAGPNSLWLAPTSVSWGPLTGPGGPVVLFGTLNGATWEIDSMNSTGSNVRPIFTGIPALTALSVSPDGQWLAYIDWWGHVYTAPTDGSSVTDLTATTLGGRTFGSVHFPLTMDRLVMHTNARAFDNAIGGAADLLPGSQLCVADVDGSNGARITDMLWDQVNPQEHVHGTLDPTGTYYACTVMSPVFGSIAGGLPGSAMNDGVPGTDGYRVVTGQIAVWETCTGGTWNTVVPAPAPPAEVQLVSDPAPPPGAQEFAVWLPDGSITYSQFPVNFMRTSHTPPWSGVSQSITTGGPVTQTVQHVTGTGVAAAPAIVLSHPSDYAPSLR